MIINATEICCFKLFSTCTNLNIESVLMMIYTFIKKMFFSSPFFGTAVNTTANTFFYEANTQAKFDFLLIDSAFHTAVTRNFS